MALGHRLSKIGRYEDAIDEFRRAYELRAEPRFLYEIAEIYRRLGATDQARFYYERYLASAPATLESALGVPDRQEVEAKLAALKRRPPRGGRGAPTPDPRSDARRSSTATTTPCPSLAALVVLGGDRRHGRRGRDSHRALPTG